MESLLRATGLPAELLQQALAPLTEGEGVLVQSCALGGERGAGHPRVVLGRPWVLGGGGGAGGDAGGPGRVRLLGLSPGDEAGAWVRGRALGWGRVWGWGSGLGGAGGAWPRGRLGLGFGLRGAGARGRVWSRGVG